MTAHHLRDQRIALALTNALAWIRAKPLMRDLYRHLPARLRAIMSARLDALVHRKLRFNRTPRWSAQQEGESCVTLPVELASNGPGINVFGYLRGEFGLAESARLFSRALIDAGVPVALFDVQLDLPHAMGDRALARWTSESTPYSTNLIFVNPDFLGEAFATIGAERLAGKSRIACWFWELPIVPADWQPAIENVDAILVASAFIAEAFGKVTKKPILHVPLPFYPGPDSGLERVDFDLQEDAFHFLCMFDFHSSIARKNPHATIEAFKRAFPDRQDVRLLVKSSNGRFHPDALRELLVLVSADSRITLRDDVLERCHLQSLLRCCDAFVSLHRAEGFGLVMAEAMGIGKPVVATRWSGNLDFMTDSNSVLVDFRLREVRAGEYLHEPGDTWAEPDIDAAAKCMLRLVEDQAYARGIGQAALLSVQAQLSPQVIGERLAHHIAVLEADSSRLKS